MRLFWLFIGLAALVLIPFLIWGDRFEDTFSATGAAEWLRGYGGRAWLAAIVLLASDLVLPVPSTMVFTALGIVYGACLRFGEAAALRLLGKEDYARGQKLFRRSGGWIVVVSRWLPVLPEVISCMAGLARMPWQRFFVALVCGSAPPAFAFAFLGQAGSQHPGLALAASAVAAPVLWLIAGRWLKRG